MEQVELNGARFAYEAKGTGEPVLLIHGAVFADGFAPLMSAPALKRYRLIRYHRRGYGSSGAIEGVQSVAQHTADALSLLHHLGIERAHIVGHSIGASIALQLALYARRVVHSLSLLESPLGSAPGADDLYTQLRALTEAYQGGAKAQTLDAFCTAIGGADYKKVVGATLGKEALDLSLQNAGSVFGSDFPAVMQWQFERDQARHVTAPVLLVVGDETMPFFQSCHDTLAQWFAAPQQLIVFRTTHLQQIANPGAVADGIARFLARHPMAAKLAYGHTERASA